MKYNIQEIQELNRRLTIKLHEVFIDKKIYEVFAEGEDFGTNGIDRKKYPINFIYFENTMLSYCYDCSLFFNNLFDVLDSQQFRTFEEKERYSQNLFEQHIRSFDMVLKRVTKLENANVQNNGAFLQAFVDNDWGVYIKRDYIVEKVIHLFNNDEKLKEFKILQPFFKNTVQNSVEFDSSIFKSQEASNLFYEYIQEYCIDAYTVYTDVSFIFQQMKEDKLLHNIPHKEFMSWLKQEKHIEEKDYDKMFEQGSFKTRDKSFSHQRNNHYSKLKEKHLNQ